MLWTFTKMQGCGNDYVYFDCFDREFPNPEENAIPLSRWHFGIGGDGLSLSSPPPLRTPGCASLIRTEAKGGCAATGYGV